MMLIMIALMITMIIALMRNLMPEGFMAMLQDLIMLIIIIMMIIATIRNSTSVKFKRDTARLDATDDEDYNLDDDCNDE